MRSNDIRRTVHPCADGGASDRLVGARVRQGASPCAAQVNFLDDRGIHARGGIIEGNSSKGCHPVHPRARGGIWVPARRCGPWMHPCAHGGTTFRTPFTDNDLDASPRAGTSSVVDATSDVGVHPRARGNQPRGSRTPDSEGCILARGEEPSDHRGQYVEGEVHPRVRGGTCHFCHQPVDRCIQAPVQIADENEGSDASSRAGREPNFL